jgi:hypothetical protein
VGDIICSKNCLTTKLSEIVGTGACLERHISCDVEAQGRVAWNTGHQETTVFLSSGEGPTGRGGLTMACAWPLECKICCILAWFSFVLQFRGWFLKVYFEQIKPEIGINLQQNNQTFVESDIKNICNLVYISYHASNFSELQAWDYHLKVTICSRYQDISESTIYYSIMFDYFRVKEVKTEEN